jgi:hypothetical protein
VIGRLLTVAALVTLAAQAQTFAIRAWFPDGAGVEVHVESTGTTSQTEVSGGGTVRNRSISRFVQDSQNATVFAYGLEAERAQEPFAVNIRIKPAKNGDPTVSAIREFPAVKIGQEIRIQILTNPSTGEHIYDVLRPLEGASPSPGYNVEGVSVPKLVLNGTAVAVKSNWATGQPARLYIPGHGAYYLSWESRPNARLAGYIEKNRLIFLMDSEYVEMTFSRAVLAAAQGGPVWVYHDRGFVPENHGGAVCLLDPY